MLSFSAVDIVEVSPVECIGTGDSYMFVGSPRCCCRGVGFFLAVSGSGAVKVGGDRRRGLAPVRAMHM